MLYQHDSVQRRHAVSVLEPWTQAEYLARVMNRKPKPPSPEPILGPLLALRVERIRERLGVASQEAWARRLGVSQSWVSRIQSGKGPGWASLEKIAASLRRAGVDPLELIGMSSDKQTAEMLKEWERANQQTRQIILDFMEYQVERQLRHPVSADGIE